MAPCRYHALYHLASRRWLVNPADLLDFAEYGRAQHDFFVVMATGPTEAMRAARERRRAHMSLTPRQNELLVSLREESQGEQTEAGYGRWSIEINADEVRAAKRLAELGLIRFADGSLREVFLEPPAFNPSLANPDQAIALALEGRMERHTAQAANTRKPGPGRL